MRRRLPRLRAAVALAAVLSAATAPALAVEGVDTKQLPTEARMAAVPGDARPAGDVNGDGVEDLVLGLGSETAAGRSCVPEPADPFAERFEYQDVAYVALGRPGRTASELRRRDMLRLGCPSVPYLKGESGGWNVGGAVASAGDVNGDGLADIAIGSVAAGPSGRPGAGSVYVVFGARDLAGRDLQALGGHGIRIDGPQPESELGWSIVAVGDVNDDGKADLAMTYTVGDGRRRGPERRRVAVVFGGLPGGARVDLRSPGAAAAILTGFDSPTSDFGSEEVNVAPAGDIDRDGRDDVALGADSNVVVLSGPARGGTLDVRRERPVLRVVSDDYEPLGAALATAGDLNGDGRPELAIGTADPPFTVSIGRRPDGTVVYGTPGVVTVVPGRPGTIDLAHPPADVRRIVGRADGSDRFGSVLAPAGDLTGDGLPDLLAGAPDASPGCRAYAGAVWVLPGRRGGGVSSLSDVRGAWRVDGATPGARLGERLAAGDVDGDGRSELLLPSASRLFVVRAGARRAPRPSANPEPCLRATLEDRSLRALRRSGRLRVRLTSSMGAGERHEVEVTVRLVPGNRRIDQDLWSGPGVRGVVRLDGAGSAAVTLRLPPRLLREATRERDAYVSVEARQSKTGDTGASVSRVFRLGVAPKGAR